MLVLQTLLVLVAKASGKILNAVFGWAVRALFGETSSRGRTFLSGLVAAAVAWPLLLLGLLRPRIAVLLLTLVPLARGVPSSVMRLVWAGLVLIIPLALGLAIAANGPPGAPPEPFVKRMLRGFPIALGLAGAFAVMFVSVPVIRLVALVRKQKSASLPLVTDALGYHQVAAVTVGVLNRHHFGLRAAHPGWWVGAPIRLLTWLTGDALRAFVPAAPEYYRSDSLTLSFYTSGVLLTGLRQHVTWAEGLIAETVTSTDGLQTFTPAAQEMERRIRRTWRGAERSNEASGQPMLRPTGQIVQLTRQLGRLDVDYDEWQVLYRQIMQLARAARGQRPLIEEGFGAGEVGALAGPSPQDGAWDQVTQRDVEAPSDRLFQQIISELASPRPASSPWPTAQSTRLPPPAGPVAANARSFGVAVLAALVTGNILLVTAALALAQKMAIRGASLIVSAFTLAIGIAALIRWNGRGPAPLDRALRRVKENLR